MTKLATQYESEFAKIVMGHSIKAAEQERQLKQKELNSLIARDKELDNLFEYLYEDNVCGKISDDRFAKMSVKYESEQKEVSSRIKELQTELESEKSKAVTSGKTVQRLTIHYNCIGAIEIPDLDKLPENNVSVHQHVINEGGSMMDSVCQAHSLNLLPELTL